MAYFCFAAAAAKSLQSRPDPVRPHRWQPTKLLCPWDSPGKDTGVGCHFLSNACMHAKLIQSCPTLCNPMDSSPPGSSAHRILQARILQWVAISVSIFCFVLFYLFIKFTMFLLWLSRGTISTNLSLENYCMLCEVFPLPIVLKQAKSQQSENQKPFIWKRTLVVIQPILNCASIIMRVLQAIICLCTFQLLPISGGD